MVIVMTIIPFAVFAQCDSTTLKKTFRKLVEMPTWTRNYPGNYTVSSPKEKTIEIGYRNTIQALPFNYQNGDYKITRVEKDFLEIIIFNKEGKGVSYCFIDGTEIRKLVPEIKVDDYFRVKVDENRLIFQFDNGKKYGIYNPETQKFCLTQ